MSPLRVAEPGPGRVLTESGAGSSAVTTFTVSPRGSASLVRISTGRDGAGGIGGLSERMLAQRLAPKPVSDDIPYQPTLGVPEATTQSTIRPSQDKGPCAGSKLD